jgi:hypothetical protein
VIYHWFGRLFLLFSINHTYTSPNHDERPPNTAIRCIVLHATAASLESARYWLCNPTSKVSAHYLISKLGAIYQLVPDGLRAWHAGESSWRGVSDCNDYSIGIELENSNSGHDIYPQIQLDALAWLCRSLLAEYRLTPNAITTHAQIAPGRKNDPRGFSLATFAAALNVTLPQQSPYTADSPLLAAPHASALTFSARNTNYEQVAVDVITQAYWAQARAVGLDPILCFAQCLHETGNLNSWWCARPRRNPAGIGVTGETSNAPRPAPFWAQRGDLWVKGYSYATWEFDAIPAHLGRLLGYALKPGDMSATQWQCYNKAMEIKSLPTAILGCAPTLRGLGGTWAVPGTGYAQAVANKANKLMGVV